MDKKSSTAEMKLLIEQVLSEREMNTSTGTAGDNAPNGQLGELVEAARIIAADNRNKAANANDYIISLFYHEEVLGADSLPANISHKPVSAIPFSDSTDLAEAIRKELEKQPRSEHVVIMQKQTAKMPINLALRFENFRGTEERPLYLAFNLVEDLTVNQKNLEALPADRRIGVVDLRHNDTVFHKFSVAVRFAISQRVNGRSDDASTLIMPQHAKSTGQRGRGRKRRGGFGDRPRNVRGRF